MAAQPSSEAPPRQPTDIKPFPYQYNFCLEEYANAVLGPDGNSNVKIGNQGWHGGVQPLNDTNHRRMQGRIPVPAETLRP